MINHRSLKEYLESFGCRMTKKSKIRILEFSNQAHCLDLASLKKVTKELSANINDCDLANSFDVIDSGNIGGLTFHEMSKK